MADVQSGRLSCPKVWQKGDQAFILEQNRSNHQPTLSPPVPVSQPALTLSMGKTQALEGDLMTLHCQSQRGSPCILYEFYYENVSLGNSSTLCGEGASFNFSMSTERSGNYYCTADNGLGAQRSEAIRISIFGESWVPADTHCYRFPSHQTLLEVCPHTFISYHNHPSPVLGSLLSQAHCLCLSTPH